ncbi:hypothetical protein OF820_08970 [Oceanotoga sp. DSM 15011]|jgi:hypothetical protein|uniref:Uncharacterized protein n=1 Tax=Oceanotoga teriensis TaxID=515440 RepID=A0AA45C575_9BACT|nr:MULTISPECIES: hypothetical protein [Oceanotoga]MDN5342763.1 hypothetical protein [Oceanotoga sp.]MDO7975787.1 hypothetical protein [Oceanotoga teriensis]PWJ88068.1 hypothetical protein C7380_1206 [Oceanotoga teriensis]UYO99202.1 hypothetical protein OF820_08970 [Oceanotoga sp. DSM 15011]
MQNVIGIIPDLIKMVEIPGHGEEKKEIVMNAIREILKALKIYHPILDIALSIIIDGLVKIIFPKKA